jgi:hypothetical protein
MSNPFLFLRAPCLTPQLPATCTTPPLRDCSSPTCAIPLPVFLFPTARFLFLFPTTRCHISDPTPLLPTARFLFLFRSSPLRERVDSPLPQLIPSAAATAASQRGGRTMPASPQLVPSAAAGNARIVPARPKRGGQTTHHPSASQRPSAAARLPKVSVPIFYKRRSASVSCSVPLRSRSSFRDEIPGTRNAPSFPVPCH